MGIYGLGDRDEIKEMRERYNAMVNVLSDILGCGRWDIEELFDSKNNIEVGEITKRWVEEFGCLPTWNDIYREALYDFASENNLEEGKDIDIYTKACLDTHIYLSEEKYDDYAEKLEDLFNMSVKEMKS